MSEKKSHHCPYEGCGSSFNRPYRLAQHLLVHKNIKAFACPEENCTKAYTNKSHLDRHLNTTHAKVSKTVTEINSCPTCFKVYSNRQNLKRHIKIHHSMKEPFSCDDCKVDFPKKHMLTAHMYVHTGIKAFSCDICSVEFVSLYEKKKHMRTHKTHSCTECSLTFKQWNKLQTHKKLEHAQSEYICNECNRSFKERNHLVRHIKIHDLRVFPCPYDNCNRFYSRNSNLRQHISIKHDMQRHECFMCGAKLATKAKLDDHVLARHTSNPKQRIYKTKAMGRKERKDAGTFRISTAMQLAGLFQIPSTSNQSWDDNLEDSNLVAQQ